MWGSANKVSWIEHCSVLIAVCCNHSVLILVLLGSTQAVIN